MFKKSHCLTWCKCGNFRIEILIIFKLFIRLIAAVIKSTFVTIIKLTVRYMNLGSKFSNFIGGIIKMFRNTLHRLKFKIKRTPM